MADSDSDSPLPCCCSFPMPRCPSSDENDSPPLSPPHMNARFGKDIFLEFLSADTRSSCEDKLEKIFSNYADRSIEIESFELEVLKLIKDDSAAVKAFKKLVIIPTELTASPSIGKIRLFSNKVRAELYDDTTRYMLWLKHLIELNNGCESFAEFKTNVEEHFAEMPDLWKEFDSVFDPVDGDTDDKVDQDLTSAGVQSDSSDQEPASQKSKTK